MERVVQRHNSLRRFLLRSDFAAEQTSVALPSVRPARCPRRHAARALSSTTSIRSSSTAVRLQQQAQDDVKGTRWQQRPKRGTTVWMAMSGGVDSSVAARLLLDQGYDVKPVFMRNWSTLDADDESGGCEWERDFADVQATCERHLSMQGRQCEPELLEFEREYFADVFQPALDAWQQGWTPNPDVACNREIKFGAFAKRVLARDPNSWLATGHYAQLVPHGRDVSLPALRRAVDWSKDQSYYLSTAPLAALSRTMFPLGGYSKKVVKQIAREMGMDTAAKRRESMGICFVGKQRDFGSFLDEYLPPQPGKLVDAATGRELGQHTGLWRYTVGQRARVAGCPERMYVARKDVHTGEVALAEKSSPLMRCIELSSFDFKWMYPHDETRWQGVAPGHKLRLRAQTRSLQDDGFACEVSCREDGSMKVDFLGAASGSEQSLPQGVAPGQVVVLYDSQVCLGGGTIAKTRTLAEHLHGGRALTPEAKSEVDA